MKERISIVVPVYNGERYIHKCISSVLKQTYSEWNLILVNDGSEDKTGEILDRYAKRDSRIVVIHQKNKGSVEARKTGVLSTTAQKNPYLMMCDADDEIPNNALEKLYKTAKEYDADLVCGKFRQMWKGILLPERYVPPCFQITEPAIYSHEEIIEKLYISYFGVTNFPVNMVAKLYKTELLTKNVEFPPVVKFMGEDLSVTIRILPEVKKLVIIPDVVYYYRTGGGTSNYMPYMMDDFISLYRYKKNYAEKYLMLQDADFFMNVELLNTTRSHFIQCMKSQQFSESELKNEIRKICSVREVYDAAENLRKMDKSISPYAELVWCNDADQIIDILSREIAKNRWKDDIKSIMKKL